VSRAASLAFDGLVSLFCLVSAAAALTSSLSLLQVVAGLGCLACGLFLAGATVRAAVRGRG